MLKRIACTIAALGLTAGLAQAQGLTIGTTAPGTALYTTGAAVAKVLSDNGVDVSLQPMGGATSILPLLGGGEVHLAMVNIKNLVEAYEGTPPFQRETPDARLLTVLHPFSVGLLVRADSDMETMADVEGRAISSGFNQMPYIQQIVEAMLATAELGPDDVDPVPAPTITRGLDDFDAGRVDVGYFSIGGARANESDASVGGIRFLPIDDSQEGLARMREVFPVAYSRVLEAGRAPGVEQDLPAMTYDMVIAVGADVPEEAVSEILSILHDNKQALGESYVGLDEFAPDQMWKDYPVPYHDAAIAFFEDKGYEPVRP